MQTGPETGHLNIIIEIFDDFKHFSAKFALNISKTIFLEEYFLKKVFLETSRGSSLVKCLTTTNCEINGRNTNKPIPKKPVSRHCVILLR